ncbi:MAG: hypothetical protein GEV07_25295 [Streptosporangiales bacterium]|nr:hypothetical protein [Streptosporangiales bacterium]
MQATRLDTVLAGRPALRPGEVVTVVAAVGGELAGMHAARQVHGAVAPAAIVLDAACRPRLGSPAARRTAFAFADGDGDGDADADVRALARLGLELLGPYPPQRLVEVLQEAHAGGVDAKALVVKVLTACRPEPVRVGSAVGGGELAPAPAPGGVVPRPVRAPAWHRVVLGRRGLGAVVVVLVVAVVVVLGWVDAGRSGPVADRPPSPVPSAHGDVPPRWHDTLTGLDRRRAVAFATADAAALRTVYVPGSAALAADLHVLRSYRRLGVRVQGLRLRIGEVRTVTASTSHAVLTVTDQLRPYRVVDRDGGVRHQPGRGDRTWQVTLDRVADQWRIASIRRHR